MQCNVKAVGRLPALQTFRRSSALHASPGSDAPSTGLRNSRRPPDAGLTAQTVLALRLTAHRSFRISPGFPRRSRDNRSDKVPPGLTIIEF
jgi:hypothetical protein